MKLFFYIVLIIFSDSCKSAKPIVSPRDVSKDDSLLISLEKTACYGTCPEYSLTIYRSGRTIYEGKRHVEKIGNFEKKISEKEVKELIKAFEEAEFFNLLNEYVEQISDFPTTFLSFNYEGKSKKIKDYYGAPEKLKKLEKIVENIGKDDGWEKK